MEKVYVIILEYHEDEETQIETRIAKSREKAEQILQEWAKQEMENSWLKNYSVEELNDYELSKNYFYAQSDDYVTTIYIKEEYIED
jgi:hypothetical protein